MGFRIATCTTSWNRTGPKNLVQELVPLSYAHGYGLAFGEFVSGPSGYTVTLDAPYAGLSCPDPNASAGGPDSPLNGFIFGPVLGAASALKAYLSRNA